MERTRLKETIFVKRVSASEGDRVRLLGYFKEHTHKPPVTWETIVYEVI